MYKHVYVLSGDSRIHVVPGLASIQILMLREHNRIAVILDHVNPHWDDETTFQETRKIISAINQQITYTEYLPKSMYHTCLNTTNPLSKSLHQRIHKLFKAINI